MKEFFSELNIFSLFDPLKKSDTYIWSLAGQLPAKFLMRHAYSDCSTTIHLLLILNYL